MKLSITRRAPVRAASGALLAACATVFLFLQGSGFVLAADKAIVWKTNEQAMLRVNDRPVDQWNVYQAGKKDNPVLLQMGGRYLLIDKQKRQVFELDPGKIAHKETDLLWDPADRPEKPLEASNWIVKDVGSGYRVSVRLVAENHVLDVQIPHPLDLRNIQ